MNMFSYKVAVWDDKNGIERNSCGFVAAKSYKGAAEIISDYFGDEMVRMTLEMVTNLPLVPIQEKYKDVVDSIDWIW